MYCTYLAGKLQEECQVPGAKQQQTDFLFVLGMSSLLSSIDSA